MQITYKIGHHQPRQASSLSEAIRACMGQEHFEISIREGESEIRISQDFRTKFCTVESGQSRLHFYQERPRDYSGSLYP